MAEHGLVITPTPIGGDVIQLPDLLLGTTYRPVELEVKRYYRNTCDDGINGFLTQQMVSNPDRYILPGSVNSIDNETLSIKDRAIVLNDRCNLSVPQGIVSVDYLKKLALDLSVNGKVYRFMYPGVWYMIRNGTVFRDGQELMSESEMYELLDELATE